MSRLDTLQKLADAQPDDPFAQYGVGLELYALQRWDEAIAAFARSLAIDAQYTAAYLQKARAEIKLGRRAEARQTLTSGVAAACAKNERHAADEMNALLETLA